MILRDPLLRKIFEYYLEISQKVAVAFVDCPSLKVPESVRQTLAKLSDDGCGMNVIFEYGLSMPVPIPDLKVTDEGIEATLSIQHTPCLTFVPWEAVVSIAITSRTDVVAPTLSLVKKKSHLKLVP